MSANTSKKRIAVVTGSRAEYGLLYWLIQGIESDADLQLQLIVTGMHLIGEFGETVRQIEADGFPIARKIDMLLASDSDAAVTKSVGLGMIGFADAYAALEPDLVVVLGDRFEILAAANAALFARIPVAHLHGGELSEGAYDDAIRHSITKMAHLHFVAAEEYRSRVIQLGENPERVFNVGAVGLDNIERLELLDRAAFQEQTGIKLGESNLVITFHPATLSPGSALSQTRELLAALGDEELSEHTLVFTAPNADNEGRSLIAAMEAFVKERGGRTYLVRSLGQLKYLSLLQYVDAMVGNSSSGLIEGPAFRIGTVNIGDRQNGRLKAATVIDCEPEKERILDAIRRASSKGFQTKRDSAANPYGVGDASGKILNILKTTDLKGLLKKQFFDLAGRDAERAAYSE
ncbi:MAG: UDP-N-acetylglucosamine 2-epimerase [Leptospirales bacterium]|jgi:GDP/UDP-N,N'-diacetylbacillosamine 2-epimerase (hydrolysing)